jgi:predicted amidohydrolase YtcJ
LAFGSDWPVAVQNPLAGLHYALNRQSWAADLPDQSQTLADAIAAYTRDAAYAEFQEQVKGQLRSGMLADIVLLSEDINAVPPETIEQVRPVLTMCNGTVVYEEEAA